MNMPSAKRCRRKSDIFVQRGIKSALGLRAGVQIETSEGAGFLANLANCEEMFLVNAFSYRYPVVSSATLFTGAIPVGCIML